MSVLKTLTTVTLMLFAPTLLGASPVHAIQDTPEMELHVIVCNYLNSYIHD